MSESVVEKKELDHTTVVEGDVSQAKEAPQGLQLVGQGKQYETVQDLETGKLNADARLDELRRELNELKNTVVDLRKERDLAVEKLAAFKPEATANKVESVNPDEIIKVVESKMNAKKADELRQANINKVNDELKKRFGTEINSVLQTRAAKLNLTVDDISRLAEKHPDAALKLILDKGDERNAPPAFQPGMRMLDVPKSHNESEYTKVIRELGDPRNASRFNELAAKAEQLAKQIGRI